MTSRNSDVRPKLYSYANIGQCMAIYNNYMKGFHVRQIVSRHCGFSFLFPDNFYWASEKNITILIFSIHVEITLLSQTHTAITDFLQG